LRRGGRRLGPLFLLTSFGDGRPGVSKGFPYKSGEVVCGRASSGGRGRRGVEGGDRRLGEANLHRGLGLQVSRGGVSQKFFNVNKVRFREWARLSVLQAEAIDVGREFEEGSGGLRGVASEEIAVLCISHDRHLLGAAGIPKLGKVVELVR
jgi:hypothetical protein